jgi:hypothetical protein
LGGLGAPVQADWRRSLVILAVLAGHAAIVLALLAMRMSEAGKSEASPRSELVFVPLAAELPEKSAPQRRRSEKSALPEYRWIGPGVPRPSNAITISPYAAGEGPFCPKELRPGTEEWQTRCGPHSKSEEGVEYSAALSRELDMKHREIWEAEMRARNTPVAVPCGYVHAFPDSGGPPPPPVKMVDLGCAAKHLFGH